MRREIGRAARDKSAPSIKLLGIYSDRVLPVAVLLVAVFLRLHNLNTIPSGLLYDEAWNGFDALRIIDGERPIFLTGNFGREALFIYLQAISITFFGQTGLALRAVSALIGIMTIIAAYMLVRRLFSARVALLTCGWLTISLWHVIFSRTGLRSVSLPLFLTIGFYCLWRGLEGLGAHVDAESGPSLSSADRTRSAIWFALGGIVIGLSLYAYTPARFAPFVIAALALYTAALQRRHFLVTLPGFVLALILATIVFLPQGLFFLHHPNSFVERAVDVWVFNPQLHVGNPGQAIFDSTLRSLGMFAIRGDPGWPHNISGRPVFDPISALLMLTGLALAVRRFRQPAYGFIIIWLVVMLVPSLLAITYTPSYLRASALIPALFILPALGTSWLWDAWESRMSIRPTWAPGLVRALPLILVTLALLGGTFHTYRSYFGSWARSPELPRFFNTDRLVSFEVAHELARTEQQPIFVAGGDYDDPLVHYTQFARAGDPEANHLRTFNHLRSVIFPADHTGANYLFAADLPHSSIVDKYFDQASAQVVRTAPSGRPITLLRLLDPRPPFEPKWPVPARFGDQIFVHGFDLPKDVRAGEVMTVRWYWSILATDQRDFTFTSQLFGADDRRRGQSDDRGFAPGYWPIGTSGISTFEIDIDPEAPTDAYWLHVAIYDQDIEDISNLPVFDTEGNQAGNHLMLGPIKIHGRPPAPAPAVENRLPASFTDQIDLLGYNLSDRQLASGESLDLTLFWSPRGRPAHDYTVFVHLLDSSGQLRGQADSPPMAGKYPTSVWDAGEVIADLHTLSLAPDLPAGEYRIAVGLYDPETGQRVKRVDGNGNMAGDHAVISGLVVVGE